MSEALTDGVRALRAALHSDDDTIVVTLSLPRTSAEKVLALLQAERTTGGVVVPVKELFTTTEAAAMLGLSRPTLMKFVEGGEIDHVKVGTHHRIPAQAILAFKRSQRASRAEAAEALSGLANDAGTGFRSNVRFGRTSALTDNEFTSGVDFE